MSYEVQSTPCGRILRTSKIGLTAAVQAEGQSALTFAWSCPTAGVVFATPAASATTVTFPSPGEYTVTLSATTSSGSTCVMQHEIKVDRVLEVRGVDEEISDHFGTLAAAIAWITANDAANAALYTILIRGQTLDAANVTVNAAKIRFVGAGRLAAGFGLIIPNNVQADIAGDAVDYRHSHINATGVGIDLQGTNCELWASNLHITATTRAILCVSATNNIYLRNVSWVTTPAAGLGTGLVAFPVNQCHLSECSGVSNANCATIDGNDTIISGGRFVTTGGFNCVDLYGNRAGHEVSIVGATVKMTGAAANGGFVGIGLQQSQVGDIKAVGNAVFSDKGSANNILSACIGAVSTVAGGTITVASNSAVHSSAGAVDVPFARGTGVGTVRVYGNSFIAAGANAARGVTTFGAGVLLLWNNAEFNNNVCRGALVSITPAAGVVLAGENLQVV